MAALGLGFGCQTPGPQFAGFDPPSPGQARLYVYRPPLAIETTPDVIFRLDGRELARVRNGGYATASLPPGKYALRVGPDGLAASPTLEQPIALAAGQTLICGYDSNGSPGSVTWRLACVDEAHAPTDLATCDLEPLSDGGSPGP